MKSYKKITALVLVVILAFSVLACVAGAKSETSTKPSDFTWAPTTADFTVTPSLSPDDPMYSSPVATTVEDSENFVSNIVSEYSSDFEDLSDVGHQFTGDFAKILQKIADFFGMLYAKLTSISDAIFNKKA